MDFESVDGQPVDLVFVLLAPEHAGADHLKALAKISRILRDPAVVAKLRGTEDAEGLYAILTEPAANLQRLGSLPPPGVTPARASFRHRHGRPHPARVSAGWRTRGARPGPPRRIFNDVNQQQSR